MKKTIAITLAGVMIFASAAVYAADQQTYNDLKTTNWAYESVKAMSDKDIIKGYPDGSFKPQSTVTYGEFIKMMVIAATGEELTVAEKPHHWAYNYYQKALELNLFAEAEIDTTMLNNAIPRSDMALIISNGLGKTDVENYSEIEKIVKDVDSTTKYDYHIIKSYATGILSGYTDHTFKPEGTLNRAESALVIYRFTDESKRTPVTAESFEKTKQDIEKEANAKKTVTIKFKGWDKTFQKNLVETTLGNYGIEKFEITSYGYIAIYSKVKYEIIQLVIDDVVVNGFVNPNGTSYWEKDSYYVYYAEPAKDGVNVKGKVPSVMMGDTVYKIKDITL